jgi:integrase
MAAADREATRHAAEVRAVEAAELATSRRITVRQLFERWAVTDLTPRVLANGKRTGRKDGGKYSREQFERRIFPTLGNVAAEDVRKGDVLAILDAVKAEGKLRTCNVLLTDMKQLMRFAVSRDILLHSPLETVTKRHAGGAETERERVLSANDVTTLARALPEAGLHKRSALALWVILATGCRVGELMGAQWMHVDTVGRAWHLPVTKNERSHIIHLSAFAVRQFEALAALHEVDPVTGEGLPWVFPDTSRKAARGSVCVKSFGKQLADRQRPANKPMKNRSKATEALILPGGKWTAHDLRRTTATLMAGIGVSGDVIDECLNHVIESRVRRTYIRDRRPVEQARAFDALGAKLDALVNGAAV